MSSPAVDDETLIRRLIDDWLIWRDTGDWDRFECLWDPDGQMVATWFTGLASDFVARSRVTFGRGALAHHEQGGTSVDVAGNRAVATTRMTLHLRIAVDGVLCDIRCLGRFTDLLRKREGRWRMALRQPVYEKDRIDPVDPSALVRLDPAMLARFPAGYRHLAYAQASGGMAVREDLPAQDGPAADRLREACVAWLRGDALDLAGVAAGRTLMKGDV